MPHINEDLELFYSQFSADHERLKRELMMELENASVPTNTPGSEVITESQLNEELVGKWYERFDRDHVRLGSELVSSLPDIYPALESGTVAKWSAVRSPSPILRAAVFVFIFFTAAFFLSTWMTRPAYALQDIFDRMLQANRIHLQGTHRPKVSNKGDIPVEIYIERPYKLWKSYVNKGATGNIAGDGLVRYLVLDSEPESNWVVPDLSCWAALELGDIVAQTIGEDIFRGDANQFDYVGTELVQGHHHDIYERRISSQRYTRLYVDQATLTPVRVVTYFIEPDGRETKVRDLDHIVIEPDEIPEHISFTAPNDLPVKPLPHPAARFGSMDQRRKIFQPVVLDMGPGAILACWSTTYSDPEVTFSLALPDGTTIASDVVNLPQSYDGTTTWNWIIVRPAEASTIDTGFSLYSEFKVSENGLEATLPYYRLPIRLDEQTIQEILNSFSDSNAAASLSTIQSSLVGH